MIVDHELSWSAMIDHALDRQPLPQVLTMVNQDLNMVDHGKKELFMVDHGQPTLDHGHLRTSHG